MQILEQLANWLDGGTALWSWATKLVDPRIMRAQKTVNKYMFRLEYVDHVSLYSMPSYMELPVEIHKVDGIWNIIVKSGEDSIRKVLPLIKESLINVMDELDLTQHEG